MLFLSYFVAIHNPKTNSPRFVYTWTFGYVSWKINLLIASISRDAHYREIQLIQSRPCLCIYQ